VTAQIGIAELDAPLRNQQPVPDVELDLVPVLAADGERDEPFGFERFAHRIELGEGSGRRKPVVAQELLVEKEAIVSVNAEGNAVDLPAVTDEIHHRRGDDVGELVLPSDGVDRLHLGVEVVLPVINDPLQEAPSAKALEGAGRVSAHHAALQFFLGLGKRRHRRIDHFGLGVAFPIHIEERPERVLLAGIGPPVEHFQVLVGSDHVVGGAATGLHARTEHQQAHESFLGVHTDLIESRRG
jgi:hypothetical protein